MIGYHCGCGYTFAVEAPGSLVPPDVICPDCGTPLQPQEMFEVAITAKGLALSAAVDGLAARSGIKIPDPPADWEPGDADFITENVRAIFHRAHNAIDANEGLVDDWCLWCGNHGVRLRSPEAAEQIVKMLRLDDPDTNVKELP